LQKIQQYDFKKIGVKFWYYWKTFDEWDFLGDNFVILKPKEREILNILYH
jgi:hypothetical protein